MDGVRLDLDDVAKEDLGAEGIPVRHNRLVSRVPCQNLNRSRALRARERARRKRERESQREREREREKRETER